MKFQIPCPNIKKEKEPHLNSIGDGEAHQDAILVLARQGPFKSNLAGLDVDGRKCWHLFRDGFPGAKRGTHRVGNAVPGGPIISRPGVDGEGVVAVRPQIADRYESLRRGLLDQSIVVVQILQLAKS